MNFRRDTFDRWLRRQARWERRRVTLEDAVVFGGFHRYFAYRLGRFAATRIVQLLLHVVELGLMFIFAEREVFIAAAAVTLAAQAVTSAWWGGLETMRRGVRRRANDGRFAAIPGWVARWIYAAGLLGGAVVAAALLFAAIRAVQGRFDVGVLYVSVRLIGLGVEIGIRTFHNGAYALRRVYQPTWSLLAPSLARALMLASLWWILGVWALPPSSLCSTAIAAVITIHFTRRTYRDLELDFRIRHRYAESRGRLPSIRDARAFLAAAASNLVAHATHLFALAVLSLGANGSPLWLDLFVYVILAAPMLEAASSWPRLFYPDLFELDTHLLRSYRDILERHVRRWAWAVGTILWLPTLLLVLPLLPYREDTIPVAIITCLFFAARARVSAVQLIAFCARRYGRVVASAVCLALGSVVGLFDANPVMVWLSVILAIASLLVPPGRERRDPPELLMPLAAFIGQADRIRGRGMWVLATIETGRLLHGAHLLLQRFVRRVGAAGLLNDRQVLWWEPAGEPPRPRARILDAFISARWASPSGEPIEALRTFHRCCARFPSAQPRPTDDVFGEFRRRFPDATLLCAGEAADDVVRRRLTWKERQAVLGEAVAHLYGRPPRRSISVDVTALVDGGRIAAIFLVPRTTPPPSRRQWRRWIRDVGVANAFAALNPSVPRMVMASAMPRVPDTPETRSPHPARLPENAGGGIPAADMYESAIE